MAVIPLGLRQVLESGDCVLFVGAAIGGHLKREDGTTAPNGKDLAKELATHFAIDHTSADLAKIAELVESRKGRPQLESFIKKALGDLTPDETLQWLTTFRWRAIFTTNYDGGIEAAYKLNGHPPQTPVSMSLTSHLEQTEPRFQVPVFHLHGSLFSSPASRIVITQTDYARFAEKRQMLWARLKTEFASSSFLYIGYSGNDWNWQLVLDELTREYYPSELPQSYRLDPLAEDIDVELLRGRHIETLKLDLQEFHDVVKKEIGDLRPDPEMLTKYRRGIHPNLLPFFEKSPAALLRFLSSWTYVNGEDFAANTNTARFLRGDRPSWALAGANIPFTRDIEEHLWDDVLEFVTSPSAKSRAIALIAPAGYGVTTELMVIASKVVTERVGQVFMLREGAEFIEGDIEFAAAMFSESACVFFVDQAREHVVAINTALSQQRQKDTRCLFVLGERKNEWRMARARIKLEEYEILPLSDAEIDRLLTFLEREHALDKLAELDRDYQFAIVKEKHEKQLLVAMREATEKEGFDAIIENEYRGIGDDSDDTANTARELYLLICAFHKEGILVRDRLLAEVLNKPLEGLYEEIGDSLEGLISFQETDAARGEYAARTRHRVIADVVWKKCGNPASREYFLQRTMEKLNLTYRLDKNVFEKFVRTDDVVQSFRTLEGKIRFFETAAKREPENPYVLQHFSRMLLREGQMTSALAQIDSALNINSMPRVLHHTRGNVLSELALASESDDLGRKWLHQAETEFRHCISLDPKDHYGHQGLALLFLRWAKKVHGIDESSDYVAKCEAAINDGLRVVRERETLWVVSADLQSWLGDQPSQIEMLKKAITENVTAVIPRYLLARVYRDQRMPDKVIEVLEPIIKSKFNEFRSFVQYTRALLSLGKTYSQCAAVLSQARLDGVTDPEFVGLLGGLLFMDGKPSEAAEVFQESVKQAFSTDERYRIQFRPRDSQKNEPLRLAGRVKSVKPSYVFIQTDKYPDFFSRTVRSGETLLQRGTEVTFEPVFTAKGAQADNVQLARATTAR